MIRFAICGMEHSGTTLVSDIFRQVPGIDAGFEVGVLLCQSPREFEGFEPFFTNMLNGWNITREALSEACKSNGFREFYDRVQGASKILKPGTTQIFDKTPRYISRLGECLDRIAVPFICLYKDPRSTVYSDFTRSKSADFDSWYATYVKSKLSYMNTCYANYSRYANNKSKRVLFVSLESLCLDSRRICEQMFTHVDIAFEKSYLVFGEQRYFHNKSNAINSRIPLEYIKVLTAEQDARIQHDFAACADWFYD